MDFTGGNIGFGFSSKRTKSTSSLDSTTTPINPDWVTQGVQDLFNRTSALGNMDPYDLVPGSNQQQDAASNTLNGLTGSPESFDAAKTGVTGILGMGAPTMTAQSLLTNFNDYRNPYDSAARQYALADYDQNAAMQQQQTNLDIANQSNWDSGGSIKDILLKRDLRNGRSALDTNLLNTSFDKAAGLSAQDAAFRQQAEMSNLNAASANRSAQLQAAGLLGDLSTAYDANQRGNAGARMDVGNDYYKILRDQRAAPLELAERQAGVFNALPLELFRGEHTTSLSQSKGKETGFSLSGSLGFGGG